MQDSPINWAVLVVNGEGQGFDSFPEAEKVKWPSNRDTPEKVQKVQVRTFRKPE